MSKIKVTFVETNCKKNGPIKQTLNIIRNMDKEVFEPSLVTVWPEDADNSMIDEYKKLGIPVLSANMSKKKSVLFGKKAVGQLLEQLQPDIVQGVGMPPYRMTLGYKRAIHFVTLRNYCYEDYPDYYGKIPGTVMAFLDLNLIKKRMAAGEPFVTCSESLTKMYRSRQNMEIPYIRNGVDVSQYTKRNCDEIDDVRRKADLFQKMSGDAKLLYAVLLDRMSLSIKNGWQDKHGNAYIICTIEEVMDSIHCARQKAVKLLDELEQEFRLIERRRQGLGKPNLLYVKDLYAGLSQSNYWKYENHTSGSLKNELPGVLKSNGSNTEKINKTDSSETDLIYPAELQEEEQYRRYFKKALELEILEQGYPADKAVLYEILELLVETVTSRKKFLRICGEDKPKEVVKSRLMKLDSSHIQYILECLKENSTQIRNIKQYLLATLYNAPVTVDSYYSAQVRHEFGWGGRVDKN